ncbi:MAG TPA: HAMP domain-containing protein, partial [Gammaproteobacteria bacterium]|nr:HAMP domain-containing protein [Gammaproteobacteria bacterium]
MAATAESARKQGRDTLTSRQVLAGLRAIKRGDFDFRLPDDYSGIDGEIAAVFNELVAQAAGLGGDLARLRQTVGKEGHTRQRLRATAMHGGWADYVAEINGMLDDVTSHTDEMARVIAAVAQGDLTQKIEVDHIDGQVQGTFLRDARAVNNMVDQLARFNSEVTRVAREVGVNGKLGAQAEVPGVSGDWKELTENVNLMASNLTAQVREIARVTTAVAQGDLTKSVNIEVKGEILELKNTINTMVDQLGSFAAEVSRVAREVGTEGRLGGQAQVEGVSGVWKELTENVNSMANNLTLQVRNIADVSTAIAHGDLSRKITVDAQGEILGLKNTINIMVDQLSSFAAEVTRVAREVGTEGQLGGQAQVEGVSGVWRELTRNVNSMATNLTDQVRNIAEVITAIAEGDLSRKITVDARGEILTLKETINSTVDKLNHFSAEVTRVARLIGTEGTLGVQAEVQDVSGIWKELTDNVNLMGRSLTDQVRDIADVTTAVANGDLSRKITVEVKGEIRELKNTINAMVDSLSSFADEVTRVAREVGTEGVLGGQAVVRGVSGIWKELTDNVNSMATNLTNQVRNIAEVSIAVATGDLSRKITVDAQGEVQDLKDTINAMVDQLNAFSAEVTRVAREVGVEGKLGGQATVAGVQGTWKELTENVNLMASNLTFQVRDIAQVATSIAQGNLDRKITVEVRGELLELKNTINTMVDQLSSFADEVTRVARDVGVEGKLGGQAEVRGVSGIWKELTDNVNLMASNLTNQVRDIAQVTTAVANGDLTRQITVEVKGEILELKNTINTMVDQLSSFADEVTRVAREVGTEGILGGQAQVKGVSGTWRELTDNVNTMADNLTEQVRGIARVVTAVAKGDLKQKLRLEASGEIATLVATINDMIDTLSLFADQVSGVARDVGVEGKLGGQSYVPGAAGIWRDLTNNVNELAGNLTLQVRAIGDVATAVTKGDLTQSINVEARGEVALLKDNINQMIRTLRETTRANQEQDWLKTNLARFTRMLQGQRDLLTVSQQVLSELAEVVSAQYGAFYMAQRDTDDEVVLRLFASYALSPRQGLAATFRLGEGLVGQAALEKERIMVIDVPSDYVTISSSLGKAAPRNIAVVPVLFESEVKGVIELATFREFTPTQLAFIDQLLESLGIVVATIEATMRTDQLLLQSQSMAEELQKQQEVLQQTNEELEEKARQLTNQKDEVERKNREVELARQELEEKAEQLALTSKYKSQFLANMSHELRTPLNSLLILSRQLAENVKENLDEKQVEYAETIYQSGADLLALINEILDLARIESGTIAIDSTDIQFEVLEEYVDRSFRHIA